MSKVRLKDWETNNGQITCNIQVEKQTIQRGYKRDQLKIDSGQHLPGIGTRRIIADGSDEDKRTAGQAPLEEDSARRWGSGIDPVMGNAEPQGENWQRPEREQRPGMQFQKETADKVSQGAGSVRERPKQQKS